MNANKVSLNVVLDRSGSMARLTRQTIQGFNTFLREQKAQPGEATLTLATFNHAYRLVHDAVPLERVNELATEDYVADGDTALWDAMGRTIDDTGKKLAAMPESERPGRVLFLIITDGEENASRYYTRADVSERIKHQREKYNWDFVFLGTEQAALFAARAVGIKHVHAYVASVQGTEALYTNVSRGVTSYRSGNDASDINGGVE